VVKSLILLTAAGVSVSAARVGSILFRLTALTVALAAAIIKRLDCIFEQKVLCKVGIEKH